MVRLKTADLDIVDTLIAAGIASNRAEAIRWARPYPRTPRLRAAAGAHPRHRPAQERVLTRAPRKCEPTILDRCR